jgi:hypothetical protein
MAKTSGAYWACRAFALTRLFIFLVCAAMYVGILVMNDGKLTYALDDPYVHLSVSETIWRGGYGVNIGEISSPSSSVLFPFLLTVGAFSTSVHEYLPFIVSLASLFATVEILRIFLLHIGFDRSSAATAIAAAFVAMATLSFNLITIVFLGMEQSLHIMLSAAAVLGLVIFLEERRTPWWFIASIALLPTIRYEGLSFSLAIVLCLLARGAWKVALGVAVFISAVLGAFSTFLVMHGLPILPSSTLAKSGAVEYAADGALARFLWSLQTTITTSLGTAPGIVLALFGVYATVVLWYTARQTPWPNEFFVAFLLLFVCAAHDVVGHFGWWGRYENYALLGGAMMALYLARGPISWMLEDPGKRMSLALSGLGVLLVFGLPYIRLAVLTPVSANNIYEQQYMMHRFITETARQPVAVADLGYTSYRNDNYVFDMLGLGSEEARRERSDLRKLNRIIQARHIKFAIFYTNWWLKNMPPDWQCVGALHLSRMRGSPARSVMDFCATRPEYAEELRQLLRDFQSRLPARIRLDILPAGN